MRTDRRAGTDGQESEGRILDKQIPLPKPIANQLACLLYASGYAEDVNQAKAIVAVEATGLLVGGN